MKFIQPIKFMSIALAAMLILSACTEGKHAGDQSDQTNYLLLNLLNRDTTKNEARLYCQETVYYMNECIGANSGFNPAVMCSDSNLVADITVDDKIQRPASTSVEIYSRLSSCVRTQVTATNCNFPQNRVGYPLQAKNNFFVTCEIDYNDKNISAADKLKKSPKGIIITAY